MYTEFAVVVGVIAVNLPFVVLTLQAVLEGIDRAIEEAALGLGARVPGAPFATSSFRSRCRASSPARSSRSSWR